MRLVLRWAVLVLVLVLLAACSGGPSVFTGSQSSTPGGETPGGETPGGEPPGEETPVEEAPIDVGRFEIAETDPSALVETEKWGLVPVDRIMVVLAEGRGGWRRMLWRPLWVGR